MDALKFNQRISNIETVLSYSAAILVVGTIPGLLKVALGAIQLVTASFASLYSKVSKDDSLQGHAWTHIKHGAGNMVAGIFEAIPVVGSIMGVIRFFKPSPYNKSIFTQHSKFMVYENIVENERNNKRSEAPLPSTAAGNNLKQPLLPASPIPPYYTTTPGAPQLPRTRIPPAPSTPVRV